MKKYIVWGLIALAVLFAGRTVLVPKMAEGLFKRAVANTMGANPATTLDDGLHVYICGAGSPLPDPKRSGACMGILAGDKAFLVDVGSGSFRNLAVMQFPIDKLEHFYLTHIHSDHFDGLGEAMLFNWVNSERTEPIPVSGPFGTSQVVEGFNMAYAMDATFRTAHHGAEIANPESYGGKGIDLDLTKGSLVVYQDDDLKITATTVDHRPVDPAFGYRFDYKDRSLYISGDTAYDPNIATYAKDVDVLFHEALNRDMVGVMQKAAEQNGATRRAKIFSDIPSYHASPVEAAKTAKAAGAGALVIYHSIPPMPVDIMKKVWAKDMDKFYERKITISQDGTIIRLPAGSDRIIYEQGL